MKAIVKLLERNLGWKVKWKVIGAGHLQVSSKFLLPAALLACGLEVNMKSDGQYDRWRRLSIAKQLSKHQVPKLESLSTRSRSPTKAVKAFWTFRRKKYTVLWGSLLMRWIQLPCSSLAGGDVTGLAQGGKNVPGTPDDMCRMADLTLHQHGSCTVTVLLHFLPRPFLPSGLNYCRVCCSDLLMNLKWINKLKSFGEKKNHTLKLVKRCCTTVLHYTWGRNKKETIKITECCNVLQPCCFMWVPLFLIYPACVWSKMTDNAECFRSRTRVYPTN